MTKWVSSWGFIPINFRYMAFTLENETQRIYVRNNIQGEKIRFRFSNRSGVTPMHLSRVTVGEAKKIGEEWHTFGCTEVTFRGRKELTLEPDEEVYSDAVDFAAKPGQWIGISTYLKERQTLNASCTTNNRTMTQVEDRIGGDFTCEELVSDRGVFREPKVPGDIRDMMMYGLRQVDVLTEEEAKTIVCFGDSITHIGHWSGWMSHRLYEKYPGKVSVINRGMGGNRLVHGEDDPTDPKNKFGSAGCKRFEKDVFEKEELDELWKKNGGAPGRGDNEVDMVVILEGINDINHAEDADSKPEDRADLSSMTEALKSCIRLSHAHNIPVYVATLTPFYNFQGKCNENTEGIRQLYNTWIRLQRDADGVFDFDRSIRDEANPVAMIPEYDIGDHLHPSFPGGKKIAEDMDLETFWDRVCHTAVR